MGFQPEDEIGSDNELKRVLNRWVAPKPSGLLVERIKTSFEREFSGAGKEVVSMKFCSVCKEEFADNFSFCPVDGTPLTTVTAPVEDPSVTVNRDPSATVSRDTVAESAAAFSAQAVENEPDWVPAASTSSAIALRDEYHLTIMDDTGLVSRLVHEVGDEYNLTWPEFKRDPFGFTKRAFVGYGLAFRKFIAKPNVMFGMGAAVFAMIALVGVVMLMDRAQGANSSRAGLI